jgi:hypothetical protein
MPRASVPYPFPGRWMLVPRILLVVHPFDSNGKKSSVCWTIHKTQLKAWKEGGHAFMIIEY